MFSPESLVTSMHPVNSTSSAYRASSSNFRRTLQPAANASTTQHPAQETDIFGVTSSSQLELPSYTNAAVSVNREHYQLPTEKISRYLTQLGLNEYQSQIPFQLTLQTKDTTGSVIGGFIRGLALSAPASEPIPQFFATASQIDALLTQLQASSQLLGLIRKEYRSPKALSKSITSNLSQLQSNPNVVLYKIPFHSPESNETKVKILFITSNKSLAQDLYRKATNNPNAELPTLPMVTTTAVGVPAYSA